MDKMIFSLDDFGPEKPKADKIVIDFNDVPAARPAAAPIPRPTPPKNMSPRQRRLMADFDKTMAFFQNFPPIRIVSFEGNPPEKYVIEYHVRGIESISGSSIKYRDTHRIEIVLGSDYPRCKPKCRMLTLPIFHPNINPTYICIGDHWAAGESLPQLIVRIGELIAFQDHNVRSPLNGTAAAWVEQHLNQLPVDSRDLTPPDYT